MHYQRWKKDGDVGQALPYRFRFRQPDGSVCAVEGCERPVRFSDKCRRHYQQDAGRRELLKGYGLSLDDYERMVARQHGRCAVCKRREAFTDGRSWCIDHDHVTGQVRGLLCSDCNRAVGLFQDDPKIIGRAGRYVERHRQMQLFGPSARRDAEALGGAS
jgi:hypothetical protein